jgi:hypothetical protein
LRFERLRELLLSLYEKRKITIQML